MGGTSTLLNKSSSASFGIDFGTTNSCICYFDSKMYQVLEIDGGKTISSVLSYENGEFLVGRKAIESLEKSSNQLLVKSIKRQIGNRNYSVQFDGEKFSSIEISAKILQYLKKKAEEITKILVKEVVISVPAYFNENQRRDIIEAAKLAGLYVLRLINEPTAASLVYEVGTCISSNLNNNQTHLILSNKEEKWLVYDLGGGTFDVTLLKVKDSYKEVISSTGDNFLGGDDFDQRIIDWIFEQLCIENFSFDKLSFYHQQNIRKLAVETKIALSIYAKKKIKYELEYNNEIIVIDLNLTREQFEDLIAPYVDLTISKTKEVLVEGNTLKENINKILFIGGSTRIPYISERIKKEFAIQPLHYVDPDLSVALGACIQAAICKGLDFKQIVIDVASHTIGVASLDVNKIFNEEAVAEEFYNIKNNNSFCDNEKEKNDYNKGDYNNGDHRFLLDQITKKHPQAFVPLIYKNTKLPAKFIKTFYTSVDNQSQIEVAIYQGESSVTNENLFIGSFLVNLNPAPKASSIQIGLEYNLNGMLNVFVEQGKGFQNSIISSYEMNLFNSPLVNLDMNIIADGSIHNSKNIYQKEKKEDVFYVSGVKNHLIDQVEKKLLQFYEGDLQNEQEKLVIENLLSKYKELLQKDLINLNDNNLLNEDYNINDSIDEIEEKLYEWIE